MRLDLTDLKNYSGFIWKIIERSMSSLGGDEKELVMEIILKQLGGMEVRGKQGEISKKALIWTVAIRRCTDHWRRKGSGAYSWFNPHDDPYRSKTKRMWRELRKAMVEDRKRNKPLLVHLCEAVEMFGLDGLKHVELFKDYAFGLTRKGVAEKHGLNEQQVKGRIEYTKKLIYKSVKRYKDRERLKI